MGVAAVVNVLQQPFLELETNKKNRILQKAGFYKLIVIFFKIYCAYK